MAPTEQEKTSDSTDQQQPIEIELKDPVRAAIYAWLWPGAGHLYQGRRAKGILFMVCILSTYFFGLAMGGGHVVYASWTPTDKRPPFFCQIGVGAPAFPALVQAALEFNGREPLFGRLMAPPEQPVRLSDFDQLAKWHREYGFLFEMGTLYTMVAGLLNVLAIYDAYAGPVLPSADKEKDEDEEPSEDERKSGDA